jgi:hypothetical protein
MLLLGLALTVGFNVALAGDTKGNGLPKGQKLLFNLEVIAYDAANCPTGNRQGHSIAVRADWQDNPEGVLANALVRMNDIMLSPGPFDVIDGNACIDGVASFQLPLNPCVEGGTVNDDCSLDDPQFQAYEVYARLVGKWGTGVDVTTCATGAGEDAVLNTADDVIVCSTENWLEMRQKGTAPKFTNRSKELLTVCLDTDGDTTCDRRVALFNNDLYDYFWNWNTFGKAHAQLFFVAVPD